MENLSGLWFEGIDNAVRKKRTLGRRPRETQSYVMTLPDRCLSPSVSPFDETAQHGYERLRNHVRDEGGYVSCQNVLALPSARMDLNGFKGMEIDREKQSISGHFGVESGNKMKRVKIKVQGKTVLKDRLNGEFGTDDSSLKGIRTDQKDIVKDAHTYTLDKGSGFKGTPLKNFSSGKNDCSMGRPGKSKPRKQVEKLEHVQKSKRAPKRRVIDNSLEVEDDEVDDEIKFLEKLRNSQSSIRHNVDDDESSRKRQKYSHGSEISMVTDNCREASGNGNQDASPTTVKDNDTSADLKKNTTLTARQRALLSGRGGGPSSPDANLEFPNGLQEAPLKKKKDNLSEKELLKKAEAAQKRRLHNEKVAQKSQEEAIRKILNQDSSKKKKEDRNRKRLEELAEEKAAEAIKHRSNTVRVVVAPTGTVVSFGENCIPSIFTAKPSSYPPPRESCAGPSCNNPYKYRDSKSKLPLCSLKCYKEVRERLDKENR